MVKHGGRTGVKASRGRLLVVEENRDLLEALQEMLEAMGFEVSAFAGEVPAIEATAGRRPEFDLIVADAAPALGDGAGLVDRFRARLGPVPALLLSGAGMSSQLRRRVAARELAVLPAPFSARQLEEAVNGAMTTRQETVRSGRAGVAPAAEAVRPTVGSARRSSLRWALPLAAGLVLAVGLAVRPPAAGPPSLPSSPGTGPSRGALVETLEPRGELEAAPRMFTWTKWPEAASYLLTVSRVDDSLVWRHAAAGVRAEPPPEVLSALLPAVRYHWSVEALDASGNPLTRSVRTEFTIHPGAPSAPGRKEDAS